MDSGAINNLGSTVVGTASAGKNTIINATVGSELMPALTTGNWTMGTGWRYLTTPNRLDKNDDGTGTVTPTAATAIVAGVTYKVVITVDSISASTCYVTLGGVRGTTLSAATTYTDYITAGTTENLILTPVATGLRATISAISIVALTDVTGDLTVYGNLKLASPIQNIKGQDSITVTASGGVIIGSQADTPAGVNARLAIYAAGAGYLIFRDTTNDVEFGEGTYAASGGACWFGASSNHPLVIRTNATEIARFDTTGRMGIGVAAPSAIIHLKAGTATASTAPIKLTSGTVLTTPEAGAIEFDGTNFYASPSSTRYTIPLETAWTDYSATSTIVGFSDFSIVKEMNVKKIGNIVFVNYALGGISNTTDLTFTVPYTSVAKTFTSYARICDNNSFSANAGCAVLAASSTTVTINKDATGAAFANSNQKRAYGQFWYECA